MCAAALLSACGQTAERATNKAPESPAATVAAPAPAPPTDTFPSTLPPTAAGQPWQLLPMGERVGPRPLAVETVGATELRNMREKLGEPTELVKGRWLAFDDQYLLYRASPRDTAWLSFELTFDDDKASGERGDITLAEVNLDGRGAPEAVVEIHSEVNGSGGGSRWRTLNVIDVARQQLLLHTTLADFTEAFPDYALLHGDTLAPEEITEGCERTVQVRGREVLISGGYDVNDTGKRCQLPGLRAGHYRYHGRRLYYRPGR
ncbi:hypothetical protein B0919_16820 [Hymenobacter sp. CRA2]|nr:hypothetical protein B0919_16820 [Hymenobacter sp. CRA2]